MEGSFRRDEQLWLARCCPRLNRDLFVTHSLKGADLQVFRVASLNLRNRRSEVRILSGACSSSRVFPVLELFSGLGRDALELEWGNSKGNKATGRLLPSVAPGFSSA